MTFYPNIPKYTIKSYLLYQLKVLYELFFIKKIKFHKFVSRLKSNQNDQFYNYIVHVCYKHRYTNMAASNKYKCTQTHSKFIWYVLLTYNKYISSNTLLVILFIILFCFKKKRNKSKTWPLTVQQIKNKLWVCHFL